MAGNEIEIVVTSKDSTNFAGPEAKSKAAAASFKADQDSMSKASGDFEKDVEKNFTAIEDHATTSGHKSSENMSDGMFAGLPLIGGVVDSISKKLASIIDDATKVGTDAGTGMAEGMTSAASAGAEDLPQLFTPQGAIGAAIVAAIVGGLAVVIGGAVATALTLGVGFGFLGIGALILKNNSTIVAGFSKLKNDIGVTLADAAQPLVGPFEKAIDTIDAMFVKIGPDLEKVFAAVAPAVSVIVDGLTGFIADIVPKLVGVGAAFTAMFNDPGVQGQLHAIASEIEFMFKTIADHPQDVADFFAILVGAISVAIFTVNALIVAWEYLDALWRNSPFAPLVTGATDLGNALLGVGDAAQSGSGDLEAFNTSLTEGEGAGHEFGQTLQELSQTLSQTAITADTLAGSMTDKLMSGLLGADEANNNFNKSLVTLGDTLVANGGHLDAHVQALKKSETGSQQNKDAILAVVQANLQVYDSQIAVGISASDAAAKYDLNTKALEAQLRAGGYNTKQIQAMIGQYENVPAKVNTDIAVNGLTTAINDLDDLIRQLNGLPPLVTATVAVHVVGASQLSSVQSTLNRLDAGNKPAGHASGGIASGLTMLAEQGRELIGNLPPGTMVHSNPDTERMLASSGGSGGGQATLGFSGGLDSAFATLVMKMFRQGLIQLNVNGQRVTV